MVNLHLSDRKEMGWLKERGLIIKGVISHCSSTKPLEIQSIFDQFIGYFNKGTCPPLHEYHGAFAGLFCNEQMVMAFVDPLRSIPLFYSVYNGELFLSDSAWWVKERVGAKKLCHVSTMEFISAGYTTGASTLYSEVKQIQPGHCLIWSKARNSLQDVMYFEHTRRELLGCPPADLHEQLEEISIEFTERLIKSCFGKPILLPLSGGYDSRYIAGMLKRAGYQNVLCYTYGRTNSFEVATSMAVAKKLGYKWEHINYDERSWQEFHVSEDVKSYFRDAHNLCSLPHIQEYTSLMRLKDSGKLPSDGIVVPGFCGDLLGGSYMPNEIGSGTGSKLVKAGLPDYLMRKHFVLAPDSVKRAGMQQISQNIAARFEGYACKTEDEFVSLNECWFTEHKVAKFVVNSLRVYEHFGLQWRMPLWDNRLVCFWYSVPNKFRIGKQLYHDYLFQNVFNPLGIGFPKPSEQRMGRLKAIIRRNAPRCIFNSVQRIRGVDTKVPGFNGFDAYAALLNGEIKPLGFQIESSNINAYLATWFMFVHLKQLEMLDVLRQLSEDEECS